MLTSHKVEGRKIRHLRVRRVIKGTAERPRLAVFRSLNHIYAQLIDDAAGRTLVAVDSRSSEFRQRQAYGGNVAAAKIVGGGKGGKPNLAFSGGPKGDAFQEALDAVEPRLKELLQSGG